jgi:hypothetical protein
MRIQTLEREDLMSSMILDNLFKIIMIKVDDIFANNQKVINKALEQQKFQVK